MITEFILTDADVGMVFPFADGFVISLVRSRAPSRKCHEMNWRERHLVLRDAKQPQNLYCLDAVNYGEAPLTIGGAQFWLINSCIPFSGELTLVCVPVGSEWELTLSDVYVAPRRSLFIHYGGGYVPNGFWGNSGFNNAANTRRRRQKQLALAAPLIASSQAEPVKIERQ